MAMFCAMELSPSTIKQLGADRIAAETGYSLRTIYRWAVEGIPGEGTVRKVRETVIATALQRIEPKVGARKAKKARAS